MLLAMRLASSSVSPFAVSASLGGRTIEQEACFEAQLKQLKAAGCEKVFSEQISAEESSWRPRWNQEYHWEACG